MSSVTGRRNKQALLAIHDLDRLGCNPIEELIKIAQMNVEAYKLQRGLTEKSDAGPAYLANAVRCYIELAKFKHPTLSAIAVKDLTEYSTGKEVMNTAQAIDIIKADPFAPKEIKEMPTQRIVDAMKSTIKEPMLPKGKKDE